MMLELTTRLREGESHNIVYENLNEAQEAKISYKTDIKECKAGDWFLTDNGYVCEILSIKVYELGSHVKQIFVQMPRCFAKMFAYKDGNIRRTPIIFRRDTIGEPVTINKYVTARMRHMIVMLKQGFTPNQAVKEAYSSKTKRVMDKQVANCMLNEAFIHELKKEGLYMEISEVLKELAIDEKWLVNQMKDTVEDKKANPKLREFCMINLKDFILRPSKAKSADVLQVNVDQTPTLKLKEKLKIAKTG